MAFDGIGVNLANMTIKILFELGCVPMIPKTNSQIRKMQVKADTHVKKVFFRIGLTKGHEPNNKTTFEVAKQYSPQLPARIDTGAYSLGMDYCFKTNPDCENCPIFYRRNTRKRLCPRKGVRLVARL